MRAALDQEQAFTVRLSERDWRTVRRILRATRNLNDEPIIAVAKLLAQIEPENEA